jgi:hypothetical protein
MTQRWRKASNDGGGSKKQIAVLTENECEREQNAISVRNAPEQRRRRLQRRGCAKASRARRKRKPTCLAGWWHASLSCTARLWHLRSRAFAVAAGSDSGVNGGRALGGVDGCMRHWSRWWRWIGGSLACGERTRFADAGVVVRPWV